MFSMNLSESSINKSGITGRLISCEGRIGVFILYRYNCQENLLILRKYIFKMSF